MNDSQKGGARLMKSEHKRRELAPLLAIFGILVGLALASLLTPEREFSPNENRYLQLKPSLTWTTLMDGTFTQKAEDYVADQIALRDRWKNPVTTNFIPEYILLLFRFHIYGSFLFR